MKNIFVHCLAITFAIIFSVTFMLNVSAINSGFELEEVSNEDFDAFIEYTEITFITSEPKKRPVDCFDVSENGTFAVGQSSIGEKTVAVYSANGEFMYGYSFVSHGSFCVEMNNEDLIIHFMRSDKSILLNSKGEIIGVFKISDTLENSSYWRKIESSFKSVGEKHYILEKEKGLLNFFDSQYTKLTVLDQDGETKTIYEATETNQFSKVLGVFCLLLPLLVVIIVLIALRPLLKKLINNIKHKKLGDDSTS